MRVMLQLFVMAVITNVLGEQFSMTVIRGKK